MLKANELRIGNYIQLPPYNTICSVEQIMNRYLFCSPISTIVDSYEGVPLTESIILDLGTLDEKGEWVQEYFNAFRSLTFKSAKHPFYITIAFDGTAPKVQWGKDGATRRVSYLHELQNLYFALTGKELILRKS